MPNAGGASSPLDSVKSPRGHSPVRSAQSDPSSMNWFLHRLYLRGELKECLRVIEDVLKKHQGLSEYPIYIKALILRQSGRIQESLQLFQAATCLNPDNKENLKQVGRSLYLLGKHTAAIEVYEEIISMGKSDDWEIHHSIGLCYMYLKEYDRAIDCFQQANAINRHDATFLQLGKVFTLREDFKGAINVYLEALEFSPENPEILTTLGLLYLRIGENFRAFDYLGNSLTHDPRNPKTILAAGSIIQDHGDMDVALVKYRVAAVQTPNSAQLWNNIGMCFFGKQRYVASVACLKRALYLDPFEWITSYNLGLVHLNTGQYASAFHHFSAAINLKPDFASSYMYLAITLGRLDDFENACSAFEKAIEMERDHMFHLNYAITLYNNDEMERAKVQFDRFEEIFETLDDESRNADPEVLEQRQALLDTKKRSMAAATCQCAALRDSQEKRLSVWREICRRFFFDGDATAKRVIEYVETCSLDHVVIDALPSDKDGGDSDGFQKALASLALSKCPVDGHTDSFSDVVNGMEREKNGVRGSFHRAIAQQKYEAFDAHVRQHQSVRYQAIQGVGGIATRHEDAFVRSRDAHHRLLTAVEEFVSARAKDIGCHPFLAGLRNVLEATLQRESVIAWQLSDAVFVESGAEYSQDAVRLLVHQLHMGHHESDFRDERDASLLVKHRLWYTDPYMSDKDIREILRRLPRTQSLQSRGTGEHHVTDIRRLNLSGDMDEDPSFIEKWCVIL
ncbi:hypothetical protein P43SY_005464 [Pythium insidiosum]|uniref:Sporangia induced Bardet-Biedl syndrome 4 protein n=1 Tax=Pythium insidiosum TaxID=114742 RepID=A0AAD5LGX3_PYTIN|nr:hypothetical protein P43SY_005464 [Pythium insidiosum]